MYVQAPRSNLEDCPADILERVALALVDEGAVGPPTDLARLLRTSKTIYSKLSRPNNAFLFSNLFDANFDPCPAVHSLGERHTTSKEKANELIKRFRALKKFKHMSCREFSATPTAREDIWIAYLMFLEHEQNNYGQLVHYGCVDSFASQYFQPGGPFHDGTERNGGWTVDNEVNALVAWLFWFTDKERMETETSEDQQRVLDALSHVFVGSFKYPSTYAPVTSFLIPPTEPPLPLPPRPALALPALPYSRPTHLEDYFGVNRVITHPLLAQAVFLICSVRLEAAAFAMLPQAHLLVGSEGPTIEELQAETRPTTEFADWSESHARDHEHDWSRLLACYDPWTQPMTRRRVFTPGMLAGTWVGRLFEIPRTEFNAILAPDPRTAAIASQPLVVHPRPMRIHIWEHHQHDRSRTLGFDDISHDFKGEGVFKAWMPRGVVVTETPGQGHLNLRLRTAGSPQTYTYDTYNPSEFARRALDEEFADMGPYGYGVYDILLTARCQIDDIFDNTGNYQKYHGRIREWDGLVVLVSESTGSNSSLLFSGYIHGKQNLVGRWRETLTPVNEPGWEGVWSMTKMD